MQELLISDFSNGNYTWGKCRVGLIHPFFHPQSKVGKLASTNQYHMFFINGTEEHDGYNYGFMNYEALFEQIVKTYYWPSLHDAFHISHHITIVWLWHSFASKSVETQHCWVCPFVGGTHKEGSTSWYVVWTYPVRSIYQNPKPCLDFLDHNLHHYAVNGCVGEGASFKDHYFVRCDYCNKKIHPHEVLNFTVLFVDWMTNHILEYDNSSQGTEAHMADKDLTIDFVKMKVTHFDAWDTTVCRYLQALQSGSCKGGCGDMYFTKLK
jgi:hypothetical protein